MPTPADKRRTFRRLHAAGCFVIPNPWDVGTANGCVPTGGVVAGWDTAAPYFNATAANKLCIKSYPATNTTSWQQSNCGCNGSSH